MSGTGERYLQDDADEAADENGKQSSAQEWTVAIAAKGEEGVMTGSSNAIHCSIVMSIGKICRCSF